MSRLEECRIALEPVPYPSDAALVATMQDEMRCYKLPPALEDFSVPLALLVLVLVVVVAERVSSRRARAAGCVTQ